MRLVGDPTAAISYTPLMTHQSQTAPHGQLLSTSSLSIFLHLLVIGLSALTSRVAHAEPFEMPRDSDTIIGEITSVTVRPGEALVDIARELDLGYDQIILANPGLNRWIPDEGAKVTVPHMYILPGSTRRGIVLNIAELRLYFYPTPPYQTPSKGTRPTIITHPVSIGRMDWRTPLGQTSVVKKERDPPWRPPPSIKQEHALEGEPLPDFIAGGAPDNPLGRFALRLGFPSYLIHGVDERKAFGIGMRVTHGCIRLYPEDIESLYSQVSVGTPVFIVNEPIKIGRREDTIFLEVHQPLEENEDEAAPLAPRLPSSEVLQFVSRRLTGFADFDPALVVEIAERGDGIPTHIGRAITPLPAEGQIAKHCSGPTTPSPPTAKSALDDEYERAVLKYLTEQ
jgi:L,D-transpeptidase ErfK/SrfK